MSFAGPNYTDINWLFQGVLTGQREQTGCRPVPGTGRMRGQHIAAELVAA